VTYIGRPERASPAEGAADLHAAEQKRIVTAALSDAPEIERSRSNGNGRKTGANGHAKNGDAGNGVNGDAVEHVEKKPAKSRS
jgi:hypothetical protein